MGFLLVFCEEILFGALFYTPFYPVFFCPILGRDFYSFFSWVWGFSYSLSIMGTSLNSSSAPKIFNHSSRSILALSVSNTARTLAIRPILIPKLSNPAESYLLSISPDLLKSIKLNASFLLIPLSSMAMLSFRKMASTVSGSGTPSFLRSGCLASFSLEKFESWFRL